MQDINELVDNARRLSKMADDAVRAMQPIQPGGLYPKVAGDYADGNRVLKIRLRVTPRLKVGVMLDLGRDRLVSRDADAVAAAVATFLEMPVDFQVWIVGQNVEGLMATWTTGKWANAPRERKS